MKLYCNEPVVLIVMALIPAQRSERTEMFDRIMTTGVSSQARKILLLFFHFRKNE